MAEKDILWRVDHPFIIRLFDTYKDKDRLYMLLEIVQVGVGGGAALAPAKRALASGGSCVRCCWRMRCAPQPSAAHSPLFCASR